MLWHILRLTSTGSRQTNSPEFQAGGSPLPRLREAAAKLARYVRLCGSLASNGASSLLPVALFARSSSSPILHNPPPPPPEKSQRSLPASGRLPGVASPAPLIFGDGASFGWARFSFSPPALSSDNPAFSESSRILSRSPLLLLLLLLLPSDFAT